MKKYLLLLAFIYVVQIDHIQCQPANNWSEPVILTDTVSYNSNPNLLINSHDLFYEKKFYPLSPTSIYYRDLYYMNEIPVLSNDSISYRNPLPIIVEYDNYYLMYESNQNGNYDIYAIEYFFNGNFGNTIQLTTTPDDESLLKVSYNYEGSYFGTWIANENVYVANIDYYFGDLFFENIEILDTGNCSNPVCEYGDVYWQRFENNEFHIYRAGNNSGNWTDPLTLYTIGNNVGLTMTRVLWDEFEGCPVWENEGEILYYNSYNGEVNTFEINGIDSAYQLSSFYYYVNTGEGYLSTVSFTTGTGNDQEIYVDGGYGLELENISNNNVKDSHSKLFQGPSCGGYWEFYCIWQSNINGYTALNSSMTYIIFGDVEESKYEKSLSIYPNPFKETLNIDLIKKNPDLSILEIFTINGKKLLRRKFQGQAGTLQSIIWNPEGDGIKLSEGIYLVKITQGKSSIVRKVVYSK